MRHENTTPCVACLTQAPSTTHKCVRKGDIHTPRRRVRASEPRAGATFYVEDYPAGLGVRQDTRGAPSGRQSRRCTGKTYLRASGDSSTAKTASMR